MKIRHARSLGSAILVLACFAGISTAIAAGSDATVARTALGTIIVNGKGMTAYFFDKDVAHSGKSNYQYAVFRKPYTASAHLKVSLIILDFSSTKCNSSLGAVCFLLMAMKTP